MVMDYTLKMQKCQALEEEQMKILVFQRDLPLSLELVTQAIDKCRKELSGLSESEQFNCEPECYVRTTKDCGGSAAVFEEFIPMKRSSSPSHENVSCEPNNNEEAENNVGDKKKSDWLSSVQLWNQSPSKETTVVVEVNREKPMAAESHQQLKPITMTPTTSTETGDRIVSEQSQMQRKQRRCWSSELHRRFLHALKQLGGSHVATPKQIRDLMKVDGLTNDQVKSHLQKYRLHTRRPATPTVTIGGDNPRQPQFMVVEGIWAPSHDATNNRVYAPVEAQPPQYSPSASGERSSRRCKSPAASSTHTPHLLPLS